MSPRIDALPTSPSGEVVVRPARPDDREHVLALMPRLEAFGLPANVSAGSVAAGEARAMAEAFERLPAGGALLVAADATDRVLGVVFLETREDYFTRVRHGHVGVLAVALEAEGRGVGRILLAAAEAWGRNEGFDRLTLSVFEGNARARRVYERAGYRPDLVRYRKDLVAAS